MEVFPMRTYLLAIVTCVLGCGGKPAATTEPQDMSKPVEMAHNATALVAPTVPAEIVVPEGHKLTFMAAAKGVQIYECAADPAGALAWKLHAPRADLLDDAGALVGSPFGGV